MRKVGILLVIFSVCALFFIAAQADIALPPSVSDCADTYDSFGKGFVEQYCIGCHTSAKKGFARKGAPPKFNFDKADMIAAEKDEIIKEVVAEKKMPPVDPKPSDAERARLKNWLACEYK